MRHVLQTGARATCLAAATLAHVAFAALPPTAYEQDQDQAPEALVINVLSVDVKVSKSSTQTVTNVRARARVEEVKRTATDLKPGVEINIAYTNVELKRDEWVVGESTYIPVLEEGKRVPAFLSGTQQTGYLPAARVYSFREIR
jgi:hypothetical protein